MLNMTTGVYDLWYDATTVGADLVVETWISHGPRAADPRFDPRWAIGCRSATMTGIRSPAAPSDAMATECPSRSISPVSATPADAGHAPPSLSTCAADAIVGSADPTFSDESTCSDGVPLMPGYVWRHLPPRPAGTIHLRSPRSQIGLPGVRRRVAAESAGTVGADGHLNR